jgi:ABC-type multidrug transport system fused ATPase/permease subunit
MRILNAYRRVLSMLGGDKRLALVLGLANIVLAGLQFLDPVLFGRVIGLLSTSDTLPRSVLWTRAATLIGVWVVIAAISISANIATVVHAERMAHRNRLQAMSRYFGHVLSLPLSFHGEAHSGRLMKVMLSGADSMFSVWLTFFREQLATYVALLVLLPLTLLLNWQLSLVLIVLVVVFCAVTIVVIHRTEAGQKRAESFQSSLAGTVQDALAWSWCSPSPGSPPRPGASARLPTT